jgi:hypothetical protein
MPTTYGSQTPATAGMPLASHIHFSLPRSQNTLRCPIHLPGALLLPRRQPQQPAAPLLAAEASRTSARANKPDISSHARSCTLLSHLLLPPHLAAIYLRRTVPGMACEPGTGSCKPPPSTSPAAGTRPPLHLLGPHPTQPTRRRSRSRCSCRASHSGSHRSRLQGMPATRGGPVLTPESPDTGPMVALPTALCTVPAPFRIWQRGGSQEPRWAARQGQRATHACHAGWLGSLSLGWHCCCCCRRRRC